MQHQETSDMDFTNVKTIIQGVKNYDHLNIKEDTNLIDELGFTSIDIMNLILELEQSFKVTFKDQDLDLDHFITPAAVMNTLQSYHVGNP